MTLNSAFQFNDELDVAYLNKIYQGDTEHAELIFGMFLAELPALTAGMRLQLDAGDVNGLYENLHKSKTSFSLVGLAHIAALMHDTEQVCNASTPFGQLKINIEHLLDAIERSKPIIEAEYAKLAACSHPHD